jgi:hypothetical protein
MDITCRICNTQSDYEKLTYIFKEGENIATALFLISGIKVKILK